MRRGTDIINAGAGSFSSCATAQRWYRLLLGHTRCYDTIHARQVVRQVAFAQALRHFRIVRSAIQREGRATVTAPQSIVRLPCRAKMGDRELARQRGALWSEIPAAAAAPSAAVIPDTTSKSTPALRSASIFLRRGRR